MTFGGFRQVMAYLGDTALVEKREVEALQSQIIDIRQLSKGHDVDIWRLSTGYELDVW